MTPEVFNKSKNLFIAFTGGTGGNHVANMLSLCPEFSPRFQHKNYKEMLVNSYRYASISKREKISANAHFYKKFNGIENTNGLVNSEQRTFLLDNQNRNIIIGHYHQWTDVYSKKLEDGFTNIVWMIFTVPSVDSLAGKRLLNTGYGFPDPKKYNLPFVPNFNKSPIVTKDTAFLFDTEILFTDQGSQYLRECVTTYFGIELPVEADMLHREWISWMKDLETISVSQ